MQKHILHWSYWLGIASFVVALVWRGLNASGVWLPRNITPNQTITYMSFYKGGFLFLLVAIATANYIWSQRHQP